MSKSSELFLEIQEELLYTRDKVINGELSNLDGLIEMRKAKEKAETVLEIVKDFENERMNEISHESEQYGNKYQGFEIKAVNGKKLYSFKGIPEIEQATNTVSSLQDKYKSAFEGVLKGIVQTTEENGIKYWIDENGEMQPLPELNIGKSYLTVKQLKQL